MPWPGSPATPQFVVKPLGQMLDNAGSLQRIAPQMLKKYVNW
jgi:hypothetical protein